MPQDRMTEPDDDGRLDVPQLVRRVRRTADLSQAQLAQRLGVSQSTVARWETGQLEPDIGLFARLVALAGYRVGVFDAAGDPVRPMRSDVERDRQGRFLPAHLDAVAQLRDGIGETYLATGHRFLRDYARKVSKRVPDDHPTLADERARLRERMRPHLERARANAVTS